MCRFVAYLGEHPIIAAEMLDKPENSLINQSRTARESLTGLNADGFGFGWYDHLIEERPSLFKSTQPAWNDSNLKGLASKIKSTCMMGHVRASTVGDVSTLNCHPFAHNNFMFVHNGTIRGFSQIRRRLLDRLSDEAFNQIKGQTDSECFFALLLDLLLKKALPFTATHMASIFQEAITILDDLLRDEDPTLITKLNIAITNGEEVLATRYISRKDEDTLSLYFTHGDILCHPNDSKQLKLHKAVNTNAVIIASEILNDCANEWEKIPVNHMLLVHKDLTTEICAI